MCIEYFLWLGLNTIQTFFSTRKHVLNSPYPVYKQARNLSLTQAPTWTALTVSSGAAIGVGPAPTGAETGRRTEEAEVMEAAAGKAAALVPPTDAPAGDGVGATAEGTGIAAGSKRAECSFPWIPEAHSSVLLFVKSIPINYKLISLKFFQPKITFIPSIIKIHNSYSLVLKEIQKFVIHWIQCSVNMFVLTA